MLSLHNIESAKDQVKSALGRLFILSSNDDLFRWVRPPIDSYTD